MKRPFMVEIGFTSICCSKVAKQNLFSVFTRRHQNKKKQQQGIINPFEILVSLVIRDLKHQDGRDGRRLPGSEIAPMSMTTHDTKAASSRPALVSDVKTDVLSSFVQRE